MDEIPGNHDLLAELAKENERLRIEIGEMKLVIESQDRGAVKLQAEVERWQAKTAKWVAKQALAADDARTAEARGLERAAEIVEAHIGEGEHDLHLWYASQEIRAEAAKLDVVYAAGRQHWLPACVRLA